MTASAPPYLTYPTTLPTDVANRLLAGITPQPVMSAGFQVWPMFGEGAYSFAGVQVPHGVVLRLDLTIDNEAIVLLVANESKRMKPFLHRVRSGMVPCRNELLPSEYARKVYDNVIGACIVSVLDHRIEHFKEPPSNRQMTAAVIALKMIEWLPALPVVVPENGAQQLESTDGDGGEERWVELEPIIEHCRLLRLSNQRVASQQKHVVPAGCTAAAWRAAVSAVLNHCNGRRCPRSFPAAWDFVTKNDILVSYQRDRDNLASVEGADTTKRRIVDMIASLGRARQQIVETAIDGYEKRLRSSSKTPPAP